MLSRAQNYIGIRDSRWLLVFIAILLFGLYFRFFTIDYGLPWLVASDEGHEINRALRLAQGEIDLERSDKGGLYYVLFVEYGIYFLFSLLAGKVSGPSEFATHFVQDPSMFYILGRSAVVVLSLMIILVTYKIGQKFFNKTVGLISMSLVAVSPAMVQNAQHINVDTPMTLLALITVYVCLNAVSNRKINPMTCGAILALAVMTKFPAVLLIIPIFIAYWYHDQNLNLIQKIWNIQIIYFVFAFILVYAIGNPAGVVVYGSKFGALLGIYSPISADPLLALENEGTSRNLWAYYFNVLLDGFGVLALMSSLIGIVLMLVLQRLKAVILLSFALLLFIACATTSSTHLYYARYMVPVYPFLALFAAYLIYLVADKTSIKFEHQKPVKYGFLIFLSCFILTLEPMYKSYKWVLTFQKENTRIAAKNWIENNIEPNTSILLRGNPIQRATLTVPLDNIASNYDVLITKVKETSSSANAVRYLELLKTQVFNKHYDLRTYRLFEPNKSVDSYLSEGVTIFIIDRRKFAPEYLDRDLKGSSEVKESRKLLYQHLQDTERFEKIFDISPETDNRNGPPIEVYKFNA